MLHHNQSGSRKPRIFQLRKVTAWRKSEIRVFVAVTYWSARGKKGVSLLRPDLLRGIETHRRCSHSRLREGVCWDLICWEGLKRTTRVRSAASTCPFVETWFVERDWNRSSSVVLCQPVWSLLRPDLLRGIETYQWAKPLTCCILSLLRPDLLRGIETTWLDGYHHQKD